MQKKLILVLLSLLFASSLHAKWWIFGGGEEEVGFDYLYANTLSFDDAGQEAIMMRESLDNGYLHVRGKARTGKNPVGDVSVSLDGGKTWNKARFEKDGGFNFSFEPDLAQTYHIVAKVIDTTGKANTLEDAQIRLSFSDLDAYGMIQETLTQLKTFYEQENDTGFMQYVDRNFEGDEMTLERALRKDFSALDNIQIDFSISSVAFSNNRYYASILFNRSVLATSDGTLYQDRGVTEFSFSVGEKGAMLLSMKNPLIFGLSYAADVASGTTANAQNNENFLVVNDSGGVSQTSLANLEEGGGDDYMTSGSFTLNNNQGFDFTDDSVTPIDHMNLASYTGHIGLFEGNRFETLGGAAAKEYGSVSIDGLTVDEAGYNEFWVGDLDTLNSDDVLAIKLPNNTYALLKITTIVNLGGGNYTISLDYKYNPNGSRYFP
ncbi:hypothetical protein JWV37_09240 [Sulfurospirillum sp. T05]|uniref:Uncharacterized protein n=1 Tax=Sulfurospirillum tamanense TaxID=2813362 RepID=A0ABS2WTG8_9BACT|nr:hypothetical protein [Sulfurospirillum tamanensis]MBN2964962.1 hypothetical protein [Sulfurospirillum tamanensis]